MTEIYILGAGGHGAVVADICIACGYSIAGFIDDNPTNHGSMVLDWRVIGGRQAITHGACVALGIGSNAIRGELYSYLENAGCQFPVLIHPSATISPFASIGAATVVLPHVVVNARAKVGNGCIINTASSVDHDCTVGNFVHIAPGVRLAGGISVGDKTLIGIGSCVHPGRIIGAEAIVGAGSVVIHDLPDNCVAYGNPAHVHR